MATYSKIDSIDLSGTRFDFTINYDIKPDIYRVNVLTLQIDGNDPSDVFARDGHYEEMINHIVKSGSTSYYASLEQRYLPPGGLSAFVYKPSLHFKSSHYTGTKQYGLPLHTSESSMIKSGRKVELHYTGCVPEYDKIKIYFIDGTNTGVLSLNGEDTVTYENVAYIRPAGSNFSINCYDYNAHSTEQPTMCYRPFVQADSSNRAAFDNYVSISTNFYLGDVGTGEPSAAAYIPVNFSTANTINYIKIIPLADTYIYLMGVAD